jgi:hypothetical protein
MCPDNSLVFYTPGGVLPPSSSFSTTTATTPVTELLSPLPPPPPLVMSYRGQGSYISHVFPSVSSHPAHILNPKMHRMSVPPTSSSSDSSNSNNSNNNNNSTNNYNKKSLLTLEMMRPTHSNVLQLLDHYSFAKDIVYSILIGIPVIISGKHENEQPVRNFVNTLKMFVPGLLPSDTSSVVPWKTTPITALDLAKLKLVGMSKKVLLSKSCEQFVSKVDLEEKTFVGPVYKGDLLDKIFSMTKQWPDERTLLSYIHSQFLAWGAKAALHYHLDSLASIRSHFYKHIPRVVNMSKNLESNHMSLTSRLSQYLPNTTTTTTTGSTGSSSGSSTGGGSGSGTTNQSTINKQSPSSRHNNNNNTTRRRRTSVTLKSPSSISIPQSSMMTVSPAASSLIDMQDLENITDYSKSICHELSITKRCDIAIIEYLAEVIKQRQRSLLESQLDSSPKYSIRLNTMEKTRMTNTISTSRQRSLRRNGSGASLRKNAT